MNSSEAAGRAREVAAVLNRFDVRPDERVLILLADGPGFAEVFSGVTRLGAVALPLNPHLSAAEVCAVAAETGARLAVGSAERVREITADLAAERLTRVDGSWEVWVARLRPH
jgi:fatty-acyl-CoA synthase/fatty acid CoA ligase FadD22